jgi:hypothetical protein
MQALQYIYHKQHLRPSGEKSNTQTRSDAMSVFGWCLKSTLFHLLFGNSLDGYQIFGIAHTTLPTLVCFSCQHLPNNGQAKPKFYLPKFLVG